MIPSITWLGDELAHRIIDEAKDILGQIGVEVVDDPSRELLSDHGATIGDDGRVKIDRAMVDDALQRAPRSFSLYDINGVCTHDYQGTRTHFTPGSAAINILDRTSREIRPAVTSDLVSLAKVVSGLPRIDAQSTALVSSDVPEAISDSYRLFINLLFCHKAVVTGAFTAGGFALIRELLVAARGSADELEKQPLAMLTCCPTSPLRWTDEGSRNLIDCASNGIPVEIVPVPLTGFMAPVTLVGTLVQHTAEVLSGVVMAQLASPGAKVVFGGSPAIFDVRFETTPMGAIETTMLTCAAAEIGRTLELPTQGYIALSDSKNLDAQAGLETGIGAVLAALSGLDNVSGPGMLDFESCQSLEKLVVDHEICLMTDRIRAGIEPRDDFPSRALFEELLSEQHLLIADHTRRHLRSELTFPGPVIDRASRARWLEEGASDLWSNATGEVDRLLTEYTPDGVDEDVRRDLVEIMASAARQHGMDELPAIEEN